MKLLIVTQAVDLDHPALGFFHGWILEFAKHCEEVTVICLKEGRHELSPNVRVLSLGKEVRRSRFSYVWRFYHYIYAYRKQYDAVFVHMNPEYAVLGGLFWKQWRKPVVLWYVHKSVTLWLKMATLFVTAICTVAPESIRLKSPKVRPMGHGIDTELFAAHGRRPSRALRILTVGRIARSKGLLEILKALDVLSERGVDFYWTIIGAPGTEEERQYEALLKEEIKRRVFADRVNYPGAIVHSELPAVFENSDILVNISSTGGYDKVVLEAAMAGVAPVSSSEPFRELLAPYGLFIAKTDPQTIAESILAAPHKDVSALRATVEKQHALSSFIPRILELLA